MLLTVLLVLLAAACYLLLQVAGRATTRRFSWRAVVLVACVIAAVRISALWFAVAALREPGPQQGLGYLASILALPEIYMVRSARTNPVQWAMRGSVLLAATSFLWAALLVLVAERFSRPRPKSP